MDLQDYRSQIDAIDEQLTKLFEKRMNIAADIADYKKAHRVPVLDTGRERVVMEKAAGSVQPELAESTRMLYALLFDLSRGYQMRRNGEHSPLHEEIQAAIEHTDPLFPPHAQIACQGVEGAYSQLAALKFFKHPSIVYFNSFEAVFTAIENGFCRYGILPLENSSAGSVNKVYTLMMAHNFRIVRSTRIKVDHQLLAKEGTRLEDVKEIFSHEQAINQCAGFLSTLKGVKVTVCENTAMAAEKVARSERPDVAAISSRSCIDLYGLLPLKSDIQDRDNNYTRFICISKNLEIYPGADKTSLMMVLPHRPGALYQVLSHFYSLGINLIKLESRPLPERDFEFMFYFDLDTSIYSREFLQMIDELDTLCEEFKYLGSYSEVL